MERNLSILHGQRQKITFTTTTHRLSLPIDQPTAAAVAVLVVAGVEVEQGSGVRSSNSPEQHQP